MAITVPRLNPSIQQAAMPNAKVQAVAPIEAFGGGAAAEKAANSITNFATDAAKVYQAEKDKADEVAVTSVKYELMREKNNLIFNPKEGAITRKGSDAFGIVPEYNDKYNKYADDLTNSLSNDRQKAMFAEFRGKMQIDLDGDLRRHQYGESEKFADETTKSALMTIQDDAILNYQNPGKVRDSIEQQHVLLLQEADRKGLPAEWVELQTKASESKIHASVLDRMLDNREYELAKEYHAATKDRLTGNDSANVEKSMQTAKVSYEGFKNASDIMQKYGTGATALEQAGKIEDEAVRKETQGNIRDAISIKKMRQEESEKANFKGAADYAESTKERPPNSVWANLSLQDRNAIDSRIEQLRQGIKPSTDWKLYSDLQYMAGNPATRQAFLDTEPYTWRSKLGDAEYKEIVKLQNDGKSGNSKQLDLLGGDVDIVTKTLEENGVDTKDKEVVGQFYRKFREQQSILQNRTGKQATDEELQQIADDLLTQGLSSEKNFFGGKKTKRKFQIGPEETLEVESKSVPVSIKKSISARLKARGVPSSAITDEMVYEVYLKSQGN